MLFSTQTLPSQISKPETKSNCEFKRISKLHMKHGDDSDLSDVLPTLEMGDILEYFTHGRFSMHNLIEYVLRVTGPADVLIATWAMTEAPLRTISRLKNEGKILKLQCMLEHKVPGHNPKSYAYAKEIFDEIWLGRNHAKVVVIENENWAVVITTSANLTRNRRIEAGDIKCSRESAEFNRKWINEQKND